MPDALYLLIAVLPSIALLILAFWAAFTKRTRLGLWMLSLPGPLLVLLLAFDWIAWDALFIFEPLLLMSLLALLALSMLVSIILLFVRKNTRKPAFYVPLVCGIAGILAARFAPFYMVNFMLFRAEREKVAAEVFAGQLRADPKHHDIVLPKNERAISAGGEVALELANNDPCVYFYYMRGLGGESSGFLYVRADAPPSPQDFASVTKVAPHWYLVSIE